MPSRRSRAFGLGRLRLALVLASVAALASIDVSIPIAAPMSTVATAAIDPSPSPPIESPSMPASRPDATPVQVHEAIGAFDASRLVDVGAVNPALRVELRYATADNFLGRNVYGDLDRCFLVADAARKLGDALSLLRTRATDLTLLTYDCARPRRVQRAMWALVEGTPQEPYVANPNVPPGSVHNTGCAVDLTLAEAATGKPLDMGTPFDFFGALAEPSRELELFAAGEISRDALANRLLLREVMVRAGFQPRANEWWHFDCESAAVARERYPVIE